MPAFSRQTKFSDGDIYRHIRIAQTAQRWTTAQSYRVELTECKEKILNQLIQHHLFKYEESEPSGEPKSIIDALDLLIPYPGLLEELELANCHRHLALHWDDPIIRFLHCHLYSTYERIVEGVAEAKEHCDITTVRHLALRCPANKDDAMFIRKKVESGALFPGLADPASRDKILKNILAIKKIIPSLKTFHENMKYFAIGAKIIKQHLVPEDDLQGHWNLVEKLQWNRPTNLTIEAADGGRLPVFDIDNNTALKALFCTAIRSFLYLSNDRPKQDIRGEVIQAGVDPGFVYLLQEEAKRLGFSSSKIEKGLTGPKPIPKNLLHVSDQQVDYKWKCGKPGLRAFLHLQKHAFLPDLFSVDGENGLVPMFVFRDFIEAFFGNDNLMMDAEQLPTPEQPATDTSALLSKGRSQLKAAPPNSKHRLQPYDRRQAKQKTSPRFTNVRSENEARNTTPTQSESQANITPNDMAMQEVSASTESVVRVDGNATQNSPVAPPKHGHQKDTQDSGQAQQLRKLRKKAKRKKKTTNVRPENEAHQTTPTQLESRANIIPNGVAIQEASIPTESIAFPAVTADRNATQRSPVASPKLSPQKSTPHSEEAQRLQELLKKPRRRRPKPLARFPLGPPNIVKNGGLLKMAKKKKFKPTVIPTKRGGTQVFFDKQPVLAFNPNPSFPFASQPQLLNTNIKLPIFAPDLIESAPGQTTESNIPFSRQPQISFANKSPNFTSIPNAIPTTINRKKRNAGHLDEPTGMTIRYFQAETNEPPLKRAKTAKETTPEASASQQSVGNLNRTSHRQRSPVAVPSPNTPPIIQQSGANHGTGIDLPHVQKVQTTPAASVSQQSVGNLDRTTRRQRSPVAVPSPNTPPIIQQSGTNHEIGIDLPHVQKPHQSGTNNEAETTLSDTTRAEAGDSWAETRTQSPGAYGYDDWNSLDRSRVATPESEL
ncbi:hypothetical protein RB594_008175 [Gaeumannomyces avenae]